MANTTEKKRQWQRARYLAARAEGRCAFGGGSSCKNPTEGGRSLCPEHLIIQADKTRRQKEKLRGNTREV